MSCAFRHVLAVLDDAEPGMWKVLERAIELAEAERARLTLAKTTDPGWIVRWLAPMAMLGRAVACPELDLTRMAGDRLAQAAEFVPPEVPLSMILLNVDTAGALARLASSGTYDLVLVRDGHLARCWRVRRVLRTVGVSVLAVCDDPQLAPAMAPPPSRGFSSASAAPRPAPRVS